ncbi:MAG: FGGY-family carbohydrate kinase, partial [Actinobacteria bacterium]|nr:FGGY-family carbohydrate kinase [Actinomycetota bacterium]
LSKLPLILKPWDIIGGLSKEAALITGLKQGTPIIAGCGDTSANMLGAGMNTPGMIFDIAGTASVFAICVDKFAPDVKHKTLFTARLVPDDLWYSLGYINGGGQNLRWFKDILVFLAGRSIKDKDEIRFKDLDEAASKVGIGSDNLIFIPHLAGRTCPNISNIKGSWIGLEWRHGSEHLYRSILESVAYEYAMYLNIEKELIPDLKLVETRVIGGGSKSDLWNKIKADILNMPYKVLNKEEFGVWGSAIIAGYGVGIFKDLKETANNHVEIEKTIDPEAENNKAYSKFVKYYSELLKQVIPIYEKFKQQFQDGK